MKNINFILYILLLLILITLFYNSMLKEHFIDSVTEICNTRKKLNLEKNFEDIRGDQGDKGVIGRSGRNGRVGDDEQKKEQREKKKVTRPNEKSSGFPSTDLLEVYDGLSQLNKKLDTVLENQCTILKKIK